MRTQTPIQPKTPPEANELLHRMTAAIDLVKPEHDRLRDSLNELYAKACAVRCETDPAVIRFGLRELKGQVTHFKAELDAHAEREEAELFPFAVWYFGSDSDAFALMERERAMAERYFDLFLDNGEIALIPFAKTEAARKAFYLFQACALLRDYFREEEDTLYAFEDHSNGYGF